MLFIFARHQIFQHIAYSKKRYYYAPYPIMRSWNTILQNCHYGMQKW